MRSAVIDLQHAPPRRIARGFGGMDDRGRVQPNVAGVRQAMSRAVALRHVLQLADRDAAQAVRARHDKQRRVVLAAIVEVRAQRDHALENFKGRLDVEDAGLDRPRAEAFALDPFANGDGAVLMPAERPVRSLRACRRARREQGVRDLQSLDLAIVLSAPPGLSNSVSAGSPAMARPRAVVQIGAP